MNTKKPMLKETVGALYYAMNTPTEAGDYNPETYESTVKSEVVKSIGTTENAETVPVRASGKDYETISNASSIDFAVELVAIDPADLAKMRAEHKHENGLMASGRPARRPFFGFGKVVKKVGGGFKYEWYPKCQLVENTDDIATKEESFSEQNDTLTIKSYTFNDAGDFKNYVDSEIEIPEGLTEEKFFTDVIITKDDLDTAIVGGA